MLNAVKVKLSELGINFFLLKKVIQSRRIDFRIAKYENGKGYLYSK